MMEEWRINSVKDLKVYKLAFDTGMEIFVMTKEFPKEEKYSLTDQIVSNKKCVYRPNEAIVRRLS